MLDSLISIVSEPLQFAFMREAMLMAVLVSIPAGLVSCYLVLKGWSLMGDAMSHAVLPGIVMAWLVGLPLVVGAFIAGMLCALAAGFISEHSRVKADAVLGVVFSTLFALGIVLFTHIDTGLHLDHVLFGDLLGVSPSDLLTSAMLAGLCLILLTLYGRDLLVYTFDALQAQVMGLNTRLLHYGLLTLLALLIVTSIKAVGIILVIGILITPGVIAMLSTHRFNIMLLISVAVATASSLGGVLLSYHIDSAPAPTIIVILSAVFLLVFLFSPHHGVLYQPGRRGQADA